MRLLLDTHVLLWAWTQPDKLSDTARSLLSNPSNERWVSAASAFEIALKFRIGKLNVEPTLVSHYLEHLRTFRADEIVITSRHALYAGALPGDHRDPFDRLIAAQSVLEGIPLVSADAAMQGFGIPIIW